MEPIGAVDLVSAVSNGERSADDYQTTLARFSPSPDCAPGGLLKAGGLVRPVPHPEHPDAGGADGQLYLVCGPKAAVDHFVPTSARQPLSTPGYLTDAILAAQSFSPGGDSGRPNLERQCAFLAELGLRHSAPVWKWPGSSAKNPGYRVGDGSQLLAWAIEGHKIALAASCAFYVLTSPDAPELELESAAPLPDGDRKPLDPHFVRREIDRQAASYLPPPHGNGSELVPEPTGWLRTLLDEPRRIFDLGEALRGPYQAPTLDMLRLQHRYPDHAHVIPLGRPNNRFMVEARGTTDATVDFVEAWRTDHAPHMEMRIKPTAQGCEVTGDPGLLRTLGRAATEAGFRFSDQLTTV